MLRSAVLLRRPPSPVANTVRVRVRDSYYEYEYEYEYCTLRSNDIAAASRRRRFLSSVWVRVSDRVECSRAETSCFQRRSQKWEASWLDSWHQQMSSILDPVQYEYCTSTKLFTYTAYARYIIPIATKRPACQYLPDYIGYIFPIIETCIGLAKTRPILCWTNWTREPWLATARYGR